MSKQQEIAKYLNSVESANLEEIYKNVSFSYYCNWRKHLGAMLSRMVKDGTVGRIKPGVFKIKRFSRVKMSEQPNPNQINLFD